MASHASSASQRRLLRATDLLCGRALHSGRASRARVSPGRPGEGIRFIRRDLGATATVPATLDAAIPASRRLLLERDRARVSTPEHLLAALFGLGIADAEVDLWGDELPFLDGSAGPFAEALWDASGPESDEAAPWRVVRGFAVRRAGAACLLVPDDELRLSASLDFGASSSLRPQRLGFRLDDPWSFRRRLASARSFGFEAEAGGLRARGLARGASLRNLLVYGPRSHSPLNPEGSRFGDEPVRHKLLDALGGLALLGGPLRGRLILERCGHTLLVATLRAAIASGALTRLPRLSGESPRRD